MGKSVCCACGLDWVDKTCIPNIHSKIKQWDYNIKLGRWKANGTETSLKKDYSCYKTQQDALFLQFILVKKL